MDQVEHLRVQVRQLETERAALYLQYNAALDREQALLRCISQDRDMFAAAFPKIVLHIIQLDGPASEIYVGFHDDKEAGDWIRKNRTARWVHVTSAPLRRPEEM